MFALFNQHQESAVFQQSLLDDKELLKLRALAEQLDCSPAPELRIDSRQAGSLPTRVLGSGSDYAESRVYQQGDDPRSINWRLSARSQDTFVKTYHIESRPSLNILLDRRRGMIFGTRRRLKITQALRAASLLAYASEFHHIDFQAWIIEDKGVDYFDDVSDFLLEANKPCADFDTTISKVKIDFVLQEIYQRTSQGSLLYLISDLADIASSDLSELSEHCFVQAIHILDEAELSLPKLGKMRLQDMHEARTYRLNTNKKKEQRLFVQRAEDTVEKRKSVVTDLGISYSQLLTKVEDIQASIVLPLGQA